MARTHGNRTSWIRRCLRTRKGVEWVGIVLVIWMLAYLATHTFRTFTRRSAISYHERDVVSHPPLGSYPAYCVDLNLTLRVEQRILRKNGQPECHELCAKDPNCYFSMEDYGERGYGIPSWELQAGIAKSIPANCSLYPKAALCLENTRPSQAEQIKQQFVVMGHAFGGDADLFLSSLRGTGFDGEIELFISESDASDPEKQKVFECYQAQTVVPEGGGSMEKLQLGLRRFQHLQVRLKERLAQGSDPWMMYVDVRDTIFQSNAIFDDIDEYGASLLLFAELHNLSHYYNFMWSNACWQNDEYYLNLTWWEKFPVVCSGGMMGKMSSVLRMCDLVVEEVENTILAGNCPNYTDSHGDHGIDQGFFNRLYYRTNLLDGWTRLLAHGQGPLVHISGRADSNLIPRDREGYLISFERPSRRVPVVHQYDRLPPLFHFFGDAPRSPCTVR